MIKWKKIKGFEGHYEISNKGKVRSVKFEDVVYLRENKIKSGYLAVCLLKNGKRKNKSIHRLVAEHFLSNDNNLSVVHHIDGNKINNTVENLEWVSFSDNIKKAFSDGLNKAIKSKDNIQSKKVNQKKDGVFIKKWDSIADIVRETGYSRSSISQVCNNKRKKAYGYTWSF